jgi:hypothetical protein
MFLKSIFSSMLSRAKGLFGRINVRVKLISLKLPFRMAIGKFGIKLQRLGRFLEVRYANWNNLFRLKIEYLSEETFAAFHVSEVIIKEAILSFGSPSSQTEKQTPMVKELFLVNGVAEIYLYPYKIVVERGVVFSWEELRPKIERVIKKHLVKK